MMSELVNTSILMVDLWWPVLSTLNMITATNVNITRMPSLAFLDMAAGGGGVVGRATVVELFIYI